MAVQEKLYTVEDLWRLSHEADGKRYELDEGELIEMAPTGDIHGIVALWIGYLLVSYVKAHDLGKVTAAETGFILAKNPEVTRAPDVAFIAKARLVPLTGGYFPLAPDLAVEVVSPSEGAAYLRRKADQYLQAGTRLVWVVYPETRLVDVYRPNQPTLTFKIDDTLDGGDVLPGFTLPVRSLFEELA